MTLPEITPILRERGFLRQSVGNDDNFLSTVFGDYGHWYRMFQESPHTDFSWSTTASGVDKTEIIYSVFKHSTYRQILIVRVGSSLGDNPGLQRLYHYRSHAASRTQAQAGAPSPESQTARQYNPVSTSVAIYQPKQAMLRSVDYGDGYDDLYAMRASASRPSANLLSNATAPWIPSLRKHLDEGETDPLWVDEETDTIYKLKHNGYSSSRMPDDTFYSVSAFDRDTLQWERTYTYTVVGAEQIDAPRWPNYFRSFWDVVLTSVKKVLAVLFVTGILYFVYLFLKSKAEAKRTLLRKERELQRTEHRAAFRKDMEKAEFLSQKNLYDKAKTLLGGLRTKYPDFSGEIDERRKRVMEAQTAHFEKKTRDNIPRT